MSYIQPGPLPPAPPLSRRQGRPQQKPRAPRPAPPPPGVVEQIRIAARNPLPALLGAAMGAVVPAAVFLVVHRHLDPGRPPWAQWAAPLAYMALGGLVFSAKTVFQWARVAFDCPWKATGFVILLEGVMVCAPGPLAAVCLAYLVGINAIATAAQLAMSDPRSRRRRRSKRGGARKRTGAKPTPKRSKAPAPEPPAQTSLFGVG